MSIVTTLHNYFVAFLHFIRTHKLLSALAAVVIIALVWWGVSAATSTKGQTKYVLGTVASGTVVASISESGQVSANDVLNLQPQVSGEIIRISVTPGEHVHAGQVIAVLDPTTAEQAVTSAQENVRSAQLALAKLEEPATTLTVTQQQNAISKAQQGLLSQYQTTFSDITNTFVDLPTIISGLQDTDLGTEAGGSSQWNIDYYESQAAQYSTQAPSYRDAAYNDYLTARTAYDQALSDFKMATSSPDQVMVEQLLAESYSTTQLLSTAAKSSNDLLQFYTDELTQNGSTPKPISTTQITNLNSYQSKAQSHLATLLSDTNALANDKNSIVESQQTLQQTQAGADPLDIETQQLSLTRAQEALAQAQETLSKYYVTAPFDGIIGSVPANAYDQGGSGTTLATLVTTKQFVDLSINEVDAAQISVGDKATLTFDAINDLTLTGTVAEINPVGTVSQGVVTYDVRVGFDAQDPRIKTGMTANAAIITGVHQNTLLVPSSAVKTQGGTSYVLVFTPPLSATSTDGTLGVSSPTSPTQVPVTTGLSDNTNTEILSGLTLGEQIVVRTVSGSTVQTTAASSGGLGGGTRGSTGGAAFRGL